MATEAVENTQEQNNLLTSIAFASVSAYLASEKGMAEIEAAVEKTVKHAIGKAIGEYSEFSKQIQELVKKSLAVYGDLDLPSYNHVVMNLIRMQVEKLTHECVQKQVASRMKDLLTPAPERIKLSELFQQYREYLKERADAGCSCDTNHAFHFSVRKSDHLFWYVEFSEETPSRRGNVDIRFGVSCLRHEGAEDVKPEGEIFTLSFADQKEVEQRMFVGPLYGFHRSIFQMQAAKTKVVIDISEHDVDCSYDTGRD